MLTKRTAIFALIVPLVALVFAFNGLAQDQADSAPAADSATDSVLELSEQPATEAASTEASESLYPMSDERKAKLIAYSNFRNIWRFLGFVISLGITALILFSGLSAKLRTWAQVAKRKFLIVGLFYALFVVADYLLSFPFHFYRSFLVEGEYGFINQTFAAWLGEDLLGLLVSVIIGVVPVWLFYWLIEKSRRWWLWFSAATVPLAILLIVVAPVVIDPIFNKFEPLQNKELESRLLQMADEAGIEGSSVFQVDASKQSDRINAYVTGLFGTKRIVLYDTMIDNFTIDEISFVMGHEMGHYLMHHVWQGLLLAIVFITFSLWLASRTMPAIISRFKHRFRFDRLSDIASLPLVIIFITVLSFLFNPVANSYSRHMERQSDKFGMDISGVSGDAAAIAFDKLSVYNLSDPDPHPFIEFWFYSHPALSKRISFVKNYRP